MSSETLIVHCEGRVATVTLNRPEVRNAFDEGLIAALSAAFATLGRRDDVRAIVLAARGKAFCAGADLGWMKRMADFSEAENLADARRLAGMLAAVHACPKPVIARVSGDVYAGGVGLVAACDMAVAVDSARFCLSEARLGLIPATIAPYVIRALGEAASRRYFLSAEAFDCATALRLGLVSEMSPAAQLDARVAALTAALCANGPAAVREAKRLVRELAGRPLDAGLQEETAAWIARVRAGDEAREGVAAFLDKRAPAWRD